MQPSIHIDSLTINADQVQLSALPLASGSTSAGAGISSWAAGAEPLAAAGPTTPLAAAGQVGRTTAPISSSRVGLWVEEDASSPDELVAELLQLPPSCLRSSLQPSFSPPGTVAGSATSAPGHGSLLQGHKQQQQQQEKEQGGSQPGFAPPYWDSSGPLQPVVEEGSPEWQLHRTPNKVDERDEGTPDDWVRRNPDMIRLTSRHPLNAEPPLSQLLQAGFHTPVALHYVRNHGAVPHLRWGEHCLTVTGLVDRPCQLSMDDLAQGFSQHSVLATLSCAGNRRREVQLVKRTQGFAWGHSAIATSEWSGVRLRELLLGVGVKRGARFIHFSGPEGEVAGGDGTYATSIPLWKGLDPLSEVVLAWRHNGRLLAPDHGYPLRVVIPGYIGGRCVKWLTRIEVSAEESRNHYHQRDNKVLPADVDQQRANQEDWWPRPEFVCYNLNIGSVIAAPAHGEVLPLGTPPAAAAEAEEAHAKQEDDGQQGGPGKESEGQDNQAASGSSSGDGDSYSLRGFAHTGAGHLVIRVELSLDGGTTWRQAGIKHREPGRTATDHNWCWVLWEAKLPVSQLECCKEVRVRAWDDTMNTQPERPTWNLIGMMNNCCFVVRVVKEEGAGGRQQLRFLHPVPNGRDLGGWMEEDRKKGRAAAEGVEPEGMEAEQEEEEAAAAQAGKGWDQLKVYGWDEIKQHTSRQSCWFVRDGRVYDATPFLDQHPGGAAAILANAGQDASAEFDPIHSSEARRMTLDFLIGKLEGAEPPAKPARKGPKPEGAPQAQLEQEREEEQEQEKQEEVKGQEQEQGKDPPALQKGKVLKAKLAEKEEITHDTRRFRFALPRKDQRLGLPVGHHITVTAQIKGEKVVRPYTPVTLDHERGYFDLVIKVYRAGQDPKHPEGGKMSQHMDSLAIGDSIDVRGPYGQFTYLGAGRFTHRGRQGSCSRMNMVGGGTGITPLYQVMRAILEDPADHTTLCLLFANKSTQDILLRRRLHRMVEEYSNRVHIYYTVDRAEAEEGWQGRVGYVSKEMVQELAVGTTTTTPSAAGSRDTGSSDSGGGEASGGGRGGSGGGGSGTTSGGKDGSGSKPGPEEVGGETDAEKAGGGGVEVKEIKSKDTGKAREQRQQQGQGQEQEQGQGQELARGGGPGGGGSGSGGTITLVCGPPPMVDKACLPALRDVGFDEHHIIVF